MINSSCGVRAPSFLAVHTNPFVISANTEPHKHTTTRHYKHLNCNPISSLFFSTLDLGYGGVHSNYSFLEHECQRMKTISSRKEKKKGVEFVSQLQGIHLDFIWGKNWRAEDRKGTNQMCLLSCGGCIVAMSLESKQELDCEI